MPSFRHGAGADAVAAARVPNSWLREVGKWAARRLGVAAGLPGSIDVSAARDAWTMPSFHAAPSGGAGDANGAMPDGIVGSAHDFSTATWNGNGSICEPCHVPHVENTSTANTPWLWNHDVSTANYTVYTSPSLVATPEQPRGVSMLCLGCHDGTVALESFGGHNGTATISGTANIGTNLSAEHPISIAWQHVGITGACGLCHNQHGQPQVISPLPFYDGRVECATCHDPHNQTPRNAGGEHMLRLPTAGSEICLLCHHK